MSEYKDGRGDYYLAEGLREQVRIDSAERIAKGDHLHEWERGKHMAEAFGIDGRRYACAICGIER